MNKRFSLHLTLLPEWSRRVLAAALLAVVLGLGALSFAPAAHAAPYAQISSTTRSAVAAPAVFNRCQEGWACLYPGPGWNGGHPTQAWYNYGTYKIYGWVDLHRVFNNQTGGAKFWLCTDTQGHNCPTVFVEDQSQVVDMGPYFSVKLTP
jgi:hypothetical protein